MDRPRRSFLVRVYGTEGPVTVEDVSTNETERVPGLDGIAPAIAERLEGERAAGGDARPVRADPQNSPTCRRPPTEPE